MPSFSSRFPDSLAPNRLADAVARRRATGMPLLDLTESNPTRVGIAYPAELVESLADSRALSYAPHALGAPAAREALIEGLGLVDVSVDDVMLTASTSEAYAHLFKLFCNPGDQVLVPAPSYPLFEHLARLESVHLATYPLEYHGLWSIDFDRFERALGCRTRAVIVVAPNNPTGSLLRADQWSRVRQICGERDIPVICDEVFVDYPLAPAPDAVRSVLSAENMEESPPVIFVLGGLSKSVGLPQHKLGWAVMRGPAELVRQVRPRLELIADTYLSVSTPVQTALPRLLSAGTVVRKSIRSRLRANLAAVRARVDASPACEVLHCEAGWSAVVRVPSTRTEDELVSELVEREGVLVHPGYFFDFPHEAFAVVSLLVDPGVFALGVDRLCRLTECQ